MKFSLTKTMKTKITITLDMDAIDLFEKIIERHRYEDEGTEMKKMFTQDRRDLRKVLSSYKTGKWAKGGSLASNLDTAVREMIPDPIWDALMNAYSYEEYSA